MYDRKAKVSAKGVAYPQGTSKSSFSDVIIEPGWKDDWIILNHLPATNHLIYGENPV